MIDELRGPGGRWAAVSLFFSFICLVLVAYEIYALSTSRPPQGWWVAAFIVACAAGGGTKFMAAWRVRKSRM